MGENTLGYRQPEAAGTYWRRRFIVLVVGLILFGIMAWSLSAALAVSRAAGSTPGAGHRHGHHGSGPAGRAQPRASDSGSAKSHPGRSAAPGHPTSGARASTSDAKTAPASTAGQATGHGQILPAFCAKSDIVLSLSTGQTQFGPGQRPAFDVNVVSTQQAECSFNIGSRHLALIIREGPALIWSSADCAAGAGGLDAALSRGVPTVLSISWNRETSVPGCSGRTIKVPPGTYTAYAVEGGLTSPPVTFRLS